MFYSFVMGTKETAILPGQRLRARGTESNLGGRFERSTRVAFDDGWDMPEDDQLVRTETRHERACSAISYNRSPDLPFDRSINPYRGCEHGCTYCFARPSHAYLNLSPGLDFETRLIARPGMGQVLARELSAKSYRAAPIAIGTNTDPYQPIEQRERVMREILEVLQRFQHPVAITTKGTLIERDLDILAPMGKAGLVRVGVSVTTLDPVISRAMEPRAALPARRLAVIRRLTEAGCPVRVMIAPVIPGLNDHELEAILSAARDAGAVAASWIMLRLPREVAGLFRDWLEARFPDRAARIMGQVRAVHGGRDYDPTFGKRMYGEGPLSELIAQRFRVATQRLGMAVKLPPLRCDQFAVPPREGDQLTLL